MALFRPKPNPPDVTIEEAMVLAYLKKLSAISDLSECEQYCFCYEIPVDVKIFQKKMGKTKIAIYRTDVVKSKNAIQVKDLGWADSWTIYYDVEIPHHGQHKPIKKFRVTQN